MENTWVKVVVLEIQMMWVMRLAQITGGLGVHALGSPYRAHDGYDCQMQYSFISKPDIDTNFVPANAPQYGVPFQWHEVCQDGKVTQSLRHVVPCVTHE